MIQALFPDCPNPAFSIRIGVGSPKRGVYDMKAFGLENSIKGLAERAVIVVDQETQGRFPVIEFPHQLSGLLGDPDFVGIGCDTGKMYAPRAQLDEKQHIDSLKPDGFDGEKVTCQDLIRVMIHQLAPTN